EIFGVAPIAEFSADTTKIDVGSQIQFTDVSTNNPTSWEWGFGDGGTSTSQNPTYTYLSIGNYTVSLTATNSYGSDTETKTNYITIVTGTFTDSRDGKTYKTVQIGTQVWMAENLNYETSSGSWVYDNNSSNASTYGRLYEWETAKDVCPSGWHLPSDDEWKQLEMAIGMSQSDAYNTGHRETNEGTKLKATSGWSNNGNGTDDYGFTALPGGYRYRDGSFEYEGDLAYFWSSTAPNSSFAVYRLLSYSYEDVYRHYTNKNRGFSVRCVRD
ncbi:MAG: FISUMP domain-containing protein, partial [Prolixibacteraceae bacterium]|nr:FISUMP domain-containing protein [Prolixibacteraceae bacterium]